MCDGASGRRLDDPMRSSLRSGVRFKDDSYPSNQPQINGMQKRDPGVRIPRFLVREYECCRAHYFAEDSHSVEVKVLKRAMVKELRHGVFLPTVDDAASQLRLSQYRGTPVPQFASLVFFTRCLATSSTLSRLTWARCRTIRQYWNDAGYCRDVDQTTSALRARIGNGRMDMPGPQHHGSGP